MILFPAVDIKDRKCVRLRKGKANAVTIYSDDPVAVAKHWANFGAKWLHIVDLDGAFQGVPINYDLVQSICQSVSIPVQLGGGIRDLQTARSYFQAGVARLIVGTMALEEKEQFKLLCQEFPGKIGVSLDAEEGMLKSKGWVKDSGLQVSGVLPELEDIGAAFVVYTDITRDGTQSGVNIVGIDRVVSETNLPVLAAGGVSYLEDIQNLYPLSEKGLAGVIVGQAIYTGSLDFVQALNWLQNQKD